MGERIVLGGPITGQHNFGMGQYMPRGLAQHASNVGFATLSKATGTETQPEVVEEPKPITRKPTQSNAARPDKEHARATEAEGDSREQARKKLIRMAIGRKVDLSVRGNGWPAFQEELRHRNGRYGGHGGQFHVVETKHLMLQFISPEVMDEMLQARFDGSRKGNENKCIRRLIEEMNDFGRRQEKTDMARERRLLDAHPDLQELIHERWSDPDNPKWYAKTEERAALLDGDGLPMYDKYGNERLDAVRRLPRDEISAWLPARFQVAPGLGSTAVGRVSIELEDKSQVLHYAREQWVDALGSQFGFDITPVSSYWMPRVDIMRTIGGRSIDNVRFSIPEMPFEMPLKSPHVYEMPAN